MTNYGWHLKSFRPQYCSAITVLNDWHYQQIRKYIFKTNTNLISMNSQIQFGNLKTELQRSRASTDAEGRPGGQVSWLWVLPEDIHRHHWLQAQVKNHHHHRHRKWQHQSTGVLLIDGEDTKNLWWWKMACLIHWDFDIYYLHLFQMSIFAK